MSSYVIGNLVGRFIVSAVIVWIVLLLAHRFNITTAARRLIRPIPFFFVIVVFFLGLAGNAIAAGVSTVSSTDKTLFYVSTFPKIGIEEILIPAEPEWFFDTHIRSQVKKLRMQSQANDDMSAVIELSRHAFLIQQEQDYAVVVEGIIDQIGAQLNTEFKAQTPYSHPLNPESFLAVTSSGAIILEHQLDIFLHKERVWTFSSVAHKSQDNRFQVLRGKVFDSIRIEVPSSSNAG